MLAIFKAWRLSPVQYITHHKSRPNDWQYRLEIWDYGFTNCYHDIFQYILPFVGVAAACRYPVGCFVGNRRSRPPSRCQESTIWSFWNWRARTSALYSNMLLRAVQRSPCRALLFISEGSHAWAQCSIWGWGGHRTFIQFKQFCWVGLSA